MIEHTQRHIPNLEFDCDICGKIFQGTNQLRVHKWRWHTENQHYKHKQTRFSDKTHN